MTLQDKADGWVLKTGYVGRDVDVPWTVVVHNIDGCGFSNGYNQRQKSRSSRDSRRDTPDPTRRTNNDGR